MSIQLLLTIGVVVFLILIYKNYRQEEEELLGLKLIGYYFLGGFRFNFNNVTLPLGYIIYIVFFRPKTNSTAKRYSAVLGLIIFIIGSFMPFITESFFERTRYIDVASNDVYQIDFVKDYLEITNKLDISNNLRLEDFKVDFEKEGNIRRLKYLLVERSKDGYVLYNVQLDFKNNRYSIKPNRVNRWLQNDTLVDAKYFFKTFESLDLRGIIPKKEYPWYTIRCRGQWENQGISQYKNYLIEDKNIRELNEEELPIEGYVLETFGNEQIDKNMYSSTDDRFYIFR